MQDAILLVLGAIIGLAASRVPPRLWLNMSDKVDKETFRTEHREQITVYYLYKLLPYGWSLLFAFLVLPNMVQWFSESSMAIFSVGYLLIGGFGFLDGVVAVVTGVSPVRHAEGKRGLQVRYLVINDSVRQAGTRQLGTLTVVGLLSWLLIRFIL